MVKIQEKTIEYDVRSYRLKLVNIVFLNERAESNNRSAAGELDTILDKLREKENG